ncbi:MAG: hypothetical protein FJX92_05895 [Bacteroidetes bacterium]|nr:hypothetical protein [Bacteroidota bacterium]
MKRIFFLCLFGLVLFTGPLLAQKDGEKEKTPFRENLFTGGSLAFSFFGNTFLIGGSPVFGYSLTNWLDLGVVANYTYSSYRDYNGVFNDKLRQTTLGGGGFGRIYPTRFLFLQAQVERNTIRQKYIPAGGGAIDEISVASSSTLIGGGYTSGRRGRGGAPFYYLAVLWDVGGDLNSPYTDAYGRSIPIVRGGLQIPLFQGRSGR